MLNKKICITLDCGILGLQKYGGISNYWNRLIEKIAEHPDFSTTFLLPKNIINNDYDFSVSAMVNSYQDKIYNVFARYMSGHVESNCDIFHTSYYRLPSSHNCIYVVTVYDFIYERYGKGPSRWLHSFQKKRALERADAIICISDSTRQDVLHYCPSIDPSRIHVVHLAVDHERFYPDQNAEDDDLSDTVLWVGQRGGHKRFDLAAKALNYHPDLKFGIVGPKLAKDEVVLLNSYCSGRWSYLGAVNESRLRQIYSSAFALIYPSDYEGFGLPILEAMACGCPVLAASTSSLPEVGGKAAVFASSQDPKDFSTKLNIIKSDRNKFVSLGIDRANLFKWEKTHNETATIYNDCFNRVELIEK